MICYMNFKVIFRSILLLDVHLLAMPFTSFDYFFTCGFSVKTGLWHLWLGYCNVLYVGCPWAILCNGKGGNVFNKLTFITPIVQTCLTTSIFWGLVQSASLSFKDSTLQTIGLPDLSLHVLCNTIHSFSVGNPPARLEGRVKQGPNLETLRSCKWQKLDLIQDLGSLTFSSHRKARNLRRFL